MGNAFLCQLLECVSCEPVEGDFCPSGTFSSNGSFSFEPVAPPPAAVEQQERSTESLVSWEASPCVMFRLIVRGSVMVDPAAAAPPTVAFHEG